MAGREAQGRDELGRFVAGMSQATEVVRGFNRQIDESTRAQAERTKEERQSQAQRTERLNVGLGVASSALGAAATTGDLADGLGSLTQAAVRGIRSFEFQGLQIGAAAAEISGLNRADRILGTAAERTLDVTADIVRYGGKVSDEFRNETIALFRDQEERVEAERRKVTGAAYTVDNVREIAGPQSARMVSLLEQILAAARALAGGAPG